MSGKGDLKQKLQDRARHTNNADQNPTKRIYGDISEILGGEGAGITDTLMGDQFIISDLFKKICGHGHKISQDQFERVG